MQICCKTAAAVAAMTILFCLPRSGAAAPSAKVVVIVSRTDMEMSKKTIDVVHGQLGDLPVVLVTEWVIKFPDGLRSQVNQARHLAEQNGAITVFWADLSMPEQIFLYISKPRGERILIRNIGTAGGSVEARLEMLAIIVRNSVRAILEGGEIGIARPREGAEDLKGATKSTLETGISYGFAPYSDGNNWLHGVRINLSYMANKWARIFLAYRVLFPVRVVDEHLSLEISSHPIEAGFAVRWRINDWQLSLGAAFFVDLVTVDVTSRSDSLTVEQPSIRALTGISPLLRVAWSPTRFVAVFFATQLDTVFNQPKYVYQSEGTDDSTYDTIISPWVVRPFIHLGVTFTIM
jgi:hypothetical protein